MRGIILVALGLCATGCGAYSQAEMDLTTQSRKGLALVAASHAAHVRWIDGLYAAQRQRLDEGFDADVKDQPAISGDWVIEARKAYATGIEAMAKQREAAVAAEEADDENIKAVDAALERLYWMESTQLNFNNQILGKEKP